MKLDTSKVKAFILAVQNAAPSELRQAIKEVADGVKKDSMRLTPVDTGTLRDSHKVELPSPGGTRAGAGANAYLAVVTVGGPGIPYAWIVHENLNAHHDVGQAKFLETAMLQNRPKLGAAIAAALARLRR